MTTLYDHWIKMIDFPAIILLLIVLMGAYVLYKTQSSENNNFDFSDMLRDDKNKPSALRLGIFVCLAISSWAIMYLIVSTQSIDTWVLVAYMAIWSGAKVAEKLVDAYAISKGASVVTQTESSTSTQTETTTVEREHAVPLGPEGNKH